MFPNKVCAQWKRHSTSPRLTVCSRTSPQHPPSSPTPNKQILSLVREKDTPHAYFTMQDRAESSITARDIPVDVTLGLT